MPEESVFERMEKEITRFFSYFDPLREPRVKPPRWVRVWERAPYKVVATSEAPDGPGVGRITLYSGGWPVKRGVMRGATRAEVQQAAEKLLDILKPT